MKSCRIIKALSSVLSLGILRDLVLCHHSEGCPCCDTNMLSKAEARLWLFEGKDVEDDPRFWPAVRDKIRQERTRNDLYPSPRYLVARRWTAIAALILLVGGGVWFIGRSGPEGIPPVMSSPIRFRLNYLKIDGASVEPVIIQPWDTDLIIVWAAEAPHDRST